MPADDKNPVPADSIRSQTKILRAIDHLGTVQKGGRRQPNVIAFVLYLLEQTK